MARQTKFDLFLNLKTANALGVKFPQAIRVRADRVIEQFMQIGR